MHQSRPDSTPALHTNKNELLIHWRTLDDRRKERESQKVFWRRRKLPRCALPLSVFLTPYNSFRKREEESGWVWAKSGTNQVLDRKDLGVLEAQLHQVSIIESFSGLFS